MTYRVLIAVLLAGCGTAPPQPTPRIVEVPGPTQIVEVEVMPQVCRDALLAADEYVRTTAQLLGEIAAAVVENPGETRGEFGARVDDIIGAFDVDGMIETWEDYAVLSDQCLEGG